MKLTFAKSTMATLLALGFAMAQPALAQTGGGMMGGKKGGAGPGMQQMSGMMHDMSDQMMGMSGDMSKGSMSPAQQQMGERMLSGNKLEDKAGESRQLKKFEKINLEKKSQSNYDPIPWPFFPFDSMRTVWNHYEQHMGSEPNSSYLHQGLDLITPIGEPAYSVIDGYVKLVLTIGGEAYWRTAISDTQIAGRSDGWLSAHLIENTIQVAIGDTVQVHDYLGDIMIVTLIGDISIL